MSKPNRNIKRPKRHAIPHHKPPTAASLQPRIDRPLFTPGQKSVIAIVIIAILAAIPFAMGKYFEFNTPGPFDSGAYVYSAQKIAGHTSIRPRKSSPALRSESTKSQAPNWGPS